jgi:hypothetical protein
MLPAWDPPPHRSLSANREGRCGDQNPDCGLTRCPAPGLLPSVHCRDPPEFQALGSGSCFQCHGVACVVGLVANLAPMAARPG